MQCSSALQVPRVIPQVCDSAIRIPVRLRINNYSGLSYTHTQKHNKFNIWHVYHRVKRFVVPCPTDKVLRNELSFRRLTISSIWKSVNGDNSTFRGSQLLNCPSITTICKFARGMWCRVSNSYDTKYLLAMFASYSTLNFLFLVCGNYHTSQCSPPYTECPRTLKSIVRKEISGQLYVRQQAVQLSSCCE